VSVPPFAKAVGDGELRYTYDYPAFAATAGVTLEVVGKVSTISCVIEQSVLTQFR
jgi:hypothetical protein